MRADAKGLVRVRARVAAACLALVCSGCLIATPDGDPEWDRLARDGSAEDQRTYALEHIRSASVAKKVGWISAPVCAALTFFSLLLSFSANWHDDPDAARRYNVAAGVFASAAVCSLGMGWLNTVAGRRWREACEGIEYPPLDPDSPEGQALKALRRRYGTAPAPSR